MDEISKKNCLKALRNSVKSVMEADTSGHDWFHIERVWKMSRYLGRKEGLKDTFIVEAAALLHDLEDWKFAEETDRPTVISLAENCGIGAADLVKILSLIDQVSFKGAGVETKPDSLEACIVQDADRLDALGAIGIARAFAYGGSRGRPLYDPEDLPQLHKSFEDYKKGRSHTINHFYEKLLLLKDRINTKSAKVLAKKRHRFLKAFLTEFFEEWQGKES